MVCSKCGAKVNASDTICSSCGATLQFVSYEFDIQAFDTLNVDNALLSNVNEADSTIIKPKQKNVKVAVIVAVVVCVLFLVSIVVLKINSDKQYNEYIMSRTFTLNEEDLQISISGYDGYGELKVSVDEQKFYYAIMPALGYEEYNETIRPILDDVLRQVNIALSKSSNLSNGQEIMAYISIDEKCLEEYDIYFEETMLEIVINDLPEMKTVDIFEDLYIDTNTAGDFVQVTWEYLGENSTYIERGISRNSTRLLNYGDVFVLSINTDVAEGLRSKYGINPLVLEKEYVVLESNDYTGWEYVNEFGNVSDRVIDRLIGKDIETMKEFGEIKSMNCDDCEYVGGFVCNYEQYNSSKQSMILVYKLNNPYSINYDGNVGYVWIEHFNLIENAYGIQRLKTGDVNEWSCDETDIKVCKSKEIKGVLDEIKEFRNLEDERISYDPALKLYLE